MDFRQYDPSTGRFYNIDLLAEATYNKTPYHFAGNNPVIGSDPTGLLTFFNGMDHSRPKMPQGVQNGYGMINRFGNTEDSFLDNLHSGYGLDPLGGGGFLGSTPYGLGTGYSGGYQGHLDYAEGGHWLYVGKRNVVSEVTGSNTDEGNDAIIGIDAIPYYIWQPAESKEGVSLIFNGSTFSLIDNGITVFSSTAVSGRPLDDGTFDYSISRQKMKSTGPIPAGNYTIDPQKIQWWTDQDRKTRTAALLGFIGVKAGTWPGGPLAWGVGRTWITPNGSEVYGRSGFTIHGGASPGSAGCIDLMGNDLRFFSTLQNYSHLNYIPLKVTY